MVERHDEARLTELLKATSDPTLVFTWESPHSIDGSTVTVDFAPVDGGTEVTLTQVRFSSEDSRDGHEQGWTAILAALGSTLEAAGKA